MESSARSSDAESSARVIAKGLLLAFWPAPLPLCVAVAAAATVVAAAVASTSACAALSSSPDEPKLRSAIESTWPRDSLPPKLVWAAHEGKLELPARAGAATAVVLVVREAALALFGGGGLLGEAALGEAVEAAVGGAVGGA